MSKTLRDLVDTAVVQAFHDGDFTTYGELLRQAVMLEVRDELVRNPDGFRQWLDGECEGHR